MLYAVKKPFTHTGGRSGESGGDHGCGRLYCCLRSIEQTAAAHIVLRVDTTRTCVSTKGRHRHCFQKHARRAPLHWLRRCNNHASLFCATTAADTTSPTVNEATNRRLISGRTYHSIFCDRDSGRRLRCQSPPALSPSRRPS